MNTANPIPTHGTVSVADSTVFEASLITTDDGEVVGARVWTYTSDPDGVSYLDSSIAGTSSQELERLSFAIREAANMLRQAGA